MNTYDPSAPLIFIHVPKAAGTSVKAVFREWFGKGLVEHYYDERKGRMPERHDLDRLRMAGLSPVVYGHFNRHRGFGVEDYYPDVGQFVTVLRDPFELSVSHYYFTRRAGKEWKDRSRVPTGELAEYLMTTAPNMLQHFPRPVTPSNFKDIIEEYFVDIGFTDELDASLTRIGSKLGKSFDAAALDHLNATARDEAIPGTLRERFAEKYELEYRVYEHARKVFAPA